MKGEPTAGDPRMENSPPIGPIVSFTVFARYTLTIDSSLIAEPGLGRVPSSLIGPAEPVNPDETLGGIN